MRTASGYDGETLVDTEHLLARELKRRGLIDVAISERKGYAEGMVQPGVLIGGNRVGVVYSWAIRPATVSFFKPLPCDFPVFAVYFGYPFPFFTGFLFWLSIGGDLFFLVVASVSRLAILWALFCWKNAVRLILDVLV